MVFFGAHSKSPNTTKIGFSLEKGFYYLWCLKAVFCWKHYFYSAFSKTQLCRHERMQLEQKQKFTKNRGCLPKCKKVFFWYVCFCFLVVLFFVACVLVLVFCKKKGPKRLFSCNFRGFLSILFPQKACLKVFLFFLFCFFAFVFPFKTPFYPFAFWPSAPFWKTLIFLVSFFFFFFLLFPFLMFACFFQTNFPNIPFWNPICFRFWLFLFSVVLVFVLVVYVSAFVFFCYAGFVFGFFLVLFCVLFCLISCFGSSLWKKAVFPAILVFLLSSVG